MIESAADLGPIEVKVFDEDPGMLYLAFGDGSGGQRAGIFVRNSGTEEKTGVNVRGSQEDKEALTAIGEAAILYLGGKMMNHDHPLAQAELEVLKALNNGPVPKDDLPMGADIPRNRLLVEVADRQHLVHLTEKGYERTPLGSRMLEMWT